MTNYKQAKTELKGIAKELKQVYKNDKPAIRMGINDAVDSICKNERLTEYQRDLLANYACTLHP